MTVQPGYLDLEAALGTPFVQPSGAGTTEHLLDRMRLTADDRTLDLGYGTGVAEQPP